MEWEPGHLLWELGGVREVDEDSAMAGVQHNSSECEEYTVACGCMLCREGGTYDSKVFTRRVTKVRFMRLLLLRRSIPMLLPPSPLCGSCCCCCPPLSSPRLLPSPGLGEDTMAGPAAPGAAGGGGASMCVVVVSHGLSHQWPHLHCHVNQSLWLAETVVIIQ